MYHSGIVHLHFTFQYLHIYSLYFLFLKHNKRTYHSYISCSLYIELWKNKVGKADNWEGIERFDGFDFEVLFLQWFMDRIILQKRVLVLVPGLVLYCISQHSSTSTFLFILINSLAKIWKNISLHFWANSAI